jgi:hypothetical protein
MQSSGELRRGNEDVRPLPVVPAKRAKRAQIRDPTHRPSSVTPIVDHASFIERFRGMGPGVRRDDTEIKPACPYTASRR